MKRFLRIALGVMILGGGVALVASQSRGADTPKVDAAALERTRERVKMVDDLYKGFVVHITGTYVDSQDRAPAAKVAKKVFKHMEDKGWGKTRLVDATGEPADRTNLPRTDFEKAAVEAMKKGKNYFEEVGTGTDGKPVLRAATIVPVVMKQCSGCHLGKKEGELLGALVYELPIK